MKNINKTMALVLVFAVCLAASGMLQSFADEPTAALMNPLHEGTKESVLEATGFAMTAPEGAQNVMYFTIDQTDSRPIAEMRFELDGKNYTYRMKGAAAFEDISGFYYTWEEQTKGKVEYVNADLYWNIDKEGMILWYDVVPGVMYSLTMDTGADPLALCTMADLLFYPLQGDDGVEVVSGPIYGTIIYITGKEFGMKEFSGDDFYRFSYGAETIEDNLKFSVGEDIMVMYKGDLKQEPVAALVSALAITTGDYPG